jgi:large subunit ribosomal protein L21
MYAVIRAGGKQYRVAPGDVIQIDRALEADKDGNVEFGGADVLAISSEAGKIAKPDGGGASVTAEVLEEGRSSKVLVFKFKRKKQYKKMQGHRQAQTTIRVTEIAYGGEKATASKSDRTWSKRASTNLASLYALHENEAGEAGETGAEKKAATRKTAGKKSSGKKSTAKKTTKKSAAKKSGGKKK